MLRQAMSLLYMLVMASRCSAVYWCDVRQAVENGSIPLSHAFRGASVNVLYPNLGDELAKYHESEDRWTGFLPSVMEATAQAGLQCRAQLFRSTRSWGILHACEL